MTLLHSNSSRSDRYLFHPVVHYAFHEHCYYFLLSGQDPNLGVTFSDALRELLENIEISSRQIDVLFGVYDALLRMWLTEEARDRFLRHLQLSRIELTSNLEFAVQHVYYQFDTKHLDPQKPLVQLHKGDIVRVVQADQGNETEDPSDSVKSLLDKGLLIQVPKSSGVKIYMILNSTTNRRTPRTEISSDLANAAILLGFTNVSVYRGSGFAEILLKGVYPKWESILSGVNGLRIAAKKMGYSPLTLVSPSYGVTNDGETIEALARPIFDSTSQFLEAVDNAGGSVRRSVSALTVAQQRGLEELCAYIAGTTPYRPRTQADKYELLRICLQGSREFLNEEALKASSIELTLRDLVPRALARIAGKTWLAQIKSAGRTATVSGEDSTFIQEDPMLRTRAAWFDESVQPRDWRLFDLLSVIQVAAVRWGEVSNVLDASLPKGWQTMKHSIITLRNICVHLGLDVDIPYIAQFENPKWSSRLIAVFNLIDFKAGISEAWDST